MMPITASFFLEEERPKIPRITALIPRSIPGRIMGEEYADRAPQMTDA